MTDTSAAAAAYVGNKTIEVLTRPAAELRPGEVEVAPAFTGICGTDLHILHGAMDARVTCPAVLGHEMSGTVSRVGPGVSGWSAGDPVTVVPLVWDGTCPACLAGNSHICQNLNFIGIDSPGAMQQRWVVPADTLLRLPAGLPLDVAALVEPTAVAVHSVGRAELRAGERVLVVGGGPVGLLVALVARLGGADVRLAEVSAYRRGLAASFGLEVLDPATEDIPAVVTEWTGGAGAALAFEVSGAAAGLTTAVDSLAVRGRLCVVAVHPVPREVNLHRFFWRELTLVGTRLYTRPDWERAVALISAGDIPARALISAVLPLGAAPDAFAALEGGGDVMKVLVDCQATGTAG
ncbi:MAG TPA: alcohol dehydrogenase catalytic domain-containing protein [Trebonia sp.]